MRSTRRPRIMAVYGVRYEPQWLVDELRRNLAWVDELVEVDDRTRSGELWVHEAKYRRMQRAALVKAGIKPWDWVLVTSPDERWEDSAAKVIPELVRRRQRVIYEFPLKELWRPDAYRIDGFWGQKIRPRLFPFLPGQRFTSKRIQTQPVPIGRGYRRIRTSKVNIYHLEQIEPLSRVERAFCYEALSPGSQARAAKSAHWRKADPTGRYMRRFGFAYLADPRGMQLRQVAANRKFHPPYTQPFTFSVPDDLLRKESGKTREQWWEWLTSTLGLTEQEVMAR